MKKYLLLFLPILALASCGKDNKAKEGYEIEYKEIELNGTKGLMVSSIDNKDVSEVTIPKNIEGNDLDVKFIAGSAFYGCENLERIELPESVFRIGDCSFRNCNKLKDIDLSNITYIGNGAFMGCSSLEEAILNDEITFLGEKAFYYCKSLKNVDLNNNMKKLPDYIFDSCYSLENIELPNELEEIGVGSFNSCRSLNNISFPVTLESIGDYAFNGNVNINNIILPENLNSLGYRSFYNCKNLITYVNNSSLNTNLISKSGITEYAKDELITLGDYSFSYDYGLYYLIKYNGDEENITLPSNIENKGYIISPYAFCNSSVKNVVIPDTVTKISNYSFSGSILDSIDFDYEKTNTESNSFYRINGNLYTVKDGIKYLKSSDNDYKYLLNSLKTTKKCVIDDNCEVILKDAFRADTLIESLKLGSNVRIIKNHAFYTDKNLSKITFNDKLEKIEEYGFYNISIEKLVLPDSVNKMGMYAFYNNTNLKDVYLSKELTEIDNNVFAGMNSIENILIYNNVKNIRSNAFNVSDDTKVYYYGNKSGFDEISISNSGNSSFFNENSIFYYSGDKPSNEGNYFHLKDGKIIVW